MSLVDVLIVSFVIAFTILSSIIVDQLEILIIDERLLIEELNWAKLIESA